MGHILDIDGPFGAETRRGSFYLFGPCVAGGNRTSDGCVAVEGDAFHFEIDIDMLADLEWTLQRVRDHLVSRGDEIPPVWADREVEWVETDAEIIGMDHKHGLTLRVWDEETRVEFDDMPEVVWERLRWKEHVFPVLVARRWPGDDLRIVFESTGEDGNRWIRRGARPSIDTLRPMDRPDKRSE